MIRKTVVLTLLNILLITGISYSQNPEVLSFDDLADITIQNSFTINDVLLELKRRNYSYIAALANLRSSLEMDLTTPETEKQSTEEYNSETELWDNFEKNTSFYQAELSYTKPFWTNGALSANINMDRFNQSGDSTDYTTRMFFQFDQPVFTSNSLKRNIYKTELRLKEAKIEYVRSRVFLIYGNGLSRERYGRGWRNRNTLSHHYYSLYESGKQLVIDERNLTILEELLALSKVKFENNQISEREYLLFEIEMNNAKDRVYSSRTNRDKSRRGLVQFSGVDPEREFTITDNILYEPIQIDLDKALEQGIRNNTGIRDLYNEIEEDSMRIDEIKSQNEFKGTLTGTLGLDKTDIQFSNQFSDFNQSQTFRLQLSAPVWDWGRQKNRIMSSEINLIRTKRELKNDTDDTVRQIIAYLNTINNMQKRIELIDRAKTISENAYTLSREQFDSGNLNTESLIQTLNKKYESESEYLRLIVDYKNALIKLTNQTQYDFEKDVCLRDEIENRIGTILENN